MEYKCNICKKDYSSYQSLWIHNKKFHKTNNIHNVSKCIPSNITTVTNVHTNIQPHDNTECKFCNKKLSNRQSRWRHEKICNQNVNNENNIFLIHIKELSNEIKELKNKLESKQNFVVQNIVNNGSINTNNTNSNNKVINVCKSGDENINLLSDSEKNFIVSQELNSIVWLVDHLNFNERIPEHHNFYVSALNDKHVNTLDYKTKSFIKESKTDLFDKILFTHMNKLSLLCKSHKNFENHYEKLKSIIFSKKYKKIFHDKVNLLSYNKKNMVLNTAKRLIADDTVTPENITEKFDEKVTQIEAMSEENCSIESISDFNSDTDSESDMDFNNFFAKQKQKLNKNNEFEV